MRTFLYNGPIIYRYNMITTIVILVSAICFLLLTIAIYSLRDKINSLENTVKELDYIITKLLCEVAHMSDKLK